jgi:hypothetical protein
MLPLKSRTNRLIAIHIRSITLEYSKYTMKIINEENNSISSIETERTMVIFLILFLIIASQIRNR